MKALMLILSILASPAVVMSEQVPERRPVTETGATSALQHPFSILTEGTSLLPDTAGLIADQESVDCLARTVYFEARGEPVAGQMAVASVVLARMASDEYPDTVCDVVTEARKPGRYRCQFTWWCDGRPDEPKNEEEYRQAKGVAMFALLLGPQPGGPTHFHAADLQPQWEMEQIATIGGHVFYN